MKDLRRILTRAMALFTAWSLILATPCTYAGDLNAEVNDMFNSLGTIGNYTAPGAFKGQAFNTYAGGSLYLRAPNKTYQLVSIAFPSANAGCGGIDVFGGSFSHISATEFKNMLKNITAALPGIAFQLALEAVSPLLGGLTKWAKGIETWVNNRQINSCETAKSLVSSAMEATGVSTQDACVKLAVDVLHLESDYEAGRKRCQTDRASILATARGTPGPAQDLAPFVGNLTWRALKNVNTLDDPARELAMSILGTVIFYPEEAGKMPEVRPPTITKISDLLYGQADAGGGNIKVQLLKCNNYAECDEVTTPPDYTHVPFTKKVEDIMRSISTKIASRTPIPNDSIEVGFVNRTSEPVWRMLSIGNTIPGSGLAESMIMNYREVIAADYAYKFLEEYLRLGINALDKRWKLDAEQRKDAESVRGRASAMLSLLADEKNKLYGKKASITNTAIQLEQLERQLRSTMPQHVMDMLGQSAALTR